MSISRRNALKLLAAAVPAAYLSKYCTLAFAGARSVIQMLIDIVSKNGNLMLNIPVRGNGTIDEDEAKVLEDLAKWIGPKSEAIYETRPFAVYGEGPSTTTTAQASHFGGVQDVRKYTAQDMRYTTKGDVVFAFVMGWPADKTVTLASLASGSKAYARQVGKIELLGSSNSVTFTQDVTGLKITLPDEKPNDIACAFKISPA
jgi:alpha-L-fucosidase